MAKGILMALVTIMLSFVLVYAIFVFYNQSQDKENYLGAGLINFNEFEKKVNGERIYLWQIFKLSGYRALVDLGKNGIIGCKVVNGYSVMGDGCEFNKENLIKSFEGYYAKNLAQELEKKELNLGYKIFVSENGKANVRGETDDKLKYEEKRFEKIGFFYSYEPDFNLSFDFNFSDFYFAFGEIEMKFGCLRNIGFIENLNEKCGLSDRFKIRGDEEYIYVDYLSENLFVGNMEIRFAIYLNTDFGREEEGIF